MPVHNGACPLHHILDIGRHTMATNKAVDHGQKPAEESGGSWQIKFVLAVIVLGVLGLIAKTTGLF